MTEQIFISHSKNDKEIVPYYVDMFNDTDTKAVRMEYESLSRGDRPNWTWIRDEILKSKALFLILTNNIVATAHTPAFYLSIPLALLAGAFTVVAPEAYKKMKMQEVN
jgi:capsid protein